MQLEDKVNLDTHMEILVEGGLLRLSNGSASVLATEASPALRIDAARLMFSLSRGVASGPNGPLFLSQRFPILRHVEAMLVHQI